MKANFQSWYRVTIKNLIGSSPHTWLTDQMKIGYDQEDNNNNVEWMLSWLGIKCPSHIFLISTEPGECSNIIIRIFVNQLEMPLVLVFIWLWVEGMIMEQLQAQRITWRGVVKENFWLRNAKTMVLRNGSHIWGRLEMGGHVWSTFSV